MIEINGVNKKFSTTAALNNVIAAVQEKSIFGLVGTNGAGKSTLLRIMCGVICPDTGSVMVDGEEIHLTPIEYKKIRRSKNGSVFFQMKPTFSRMPQVRVWRNIMRSCIRILMNIVFLISWSGFN